MIRYRIDPERSRARYAGETDSVLAMWFVNDTARVTGELAWDSHADEVLAGEIVVAFAKLPGTKDTTSFRKLLGVTQPHQLRVDQLRLAGDGVDARLDLGRGPVHEGFEVTASERTDDAFDLSLTTRILLGSDRDPFGVRTQRGSVMISGVVEITLELHAVAALRSPSAS